MDGMEFVASLVRSLAWPTVVVVIAVCFRSSIRSTLDGQIKRWKAGPTGVEIEYWEQTVAEAVQQLPVDADAQAEQTLGGGLAGELGPVAAVAPGAAVLEAFARVERELRRITAGLEQGEQLERMGARQLAVVAQRHGQISAESLSAIDGMSVMRNLAAHGRAGHLDETRALAYVHLADAVLFALGHDLPPES